VGFRISIVALCWALAAPALAQEQAVESLAAAARQNRRDADAQSAYGLALLRAGRHREAKRALQTAARLDRDEPARVFDVARVAFAEGEYRPARAACRPLSRFDSSPLGHVCMARAFLVWNRSARAFEELEAALAMDGNDFEALLALGDAHRLRNAVSDAESAYQRAARANPDSALPHLGLGRLYLATNRRNEALRALRTADQKPELEAGSARPDAGHPEIAYALGRALGGSEGIPFLRRAAEGRPGWAEAQITLGDALLATDDIPGARAAYEAAIRASRVNADAHVGLGRALTEAGEHEAAMAELERGLELVENHPGAVFAKAKLYEAMSRNEEAFRTYRQAADLMQGNPEPMLSAARLALRLNRDVLAVGFLERLLQQHDNLSAALELYGDAMLSRRDRARAREYYQRALRGSGPVNRRRIRQQLSGL
jgi:superkiller protein 3